MKCQLCICELVYYQSCHNYKVNAYRVNCGLKLLKKFEKNQRANHFGQLVNARQTQMHMKYQGPINCVLVR